MGALYMIAVAVIGHKFGFLTDISLFCPIYRVYINKNSVALVRKRTIPTERPPLVGEVVITFVDRGCRMVSATDSHGR
jgi:histidinol phosphatase-like PHP family hydrolase